MASWPFMAERCQFHLAQNAIHHAPTVAIRKRPGIGRGGQLREIWNAKNLSSAEAELKALLEAYRKSAPELAAWLEAAIPEGLAVFTLPEHHGQAHGDRQPDRTRRPAGAQTSNGQSPRLPQQRLAAAPRHRGARRNRRNMAGFNTTLHQLEHPGCLIGPPTNFQTSGCVIVQRLAARLGSRLDPAQNIVLQTIEKQ